MNLSLNKGIKMREKIFFALIIVSLFMLSYCFNEKSINENERNDTKSAYNIISLTYTEKEVEILYPSISGLQDAEEQILINNLLKKEAFSELTDWLQSGENKIEDIGLSIEYKILFQSTNYLCVNYTGWVCINNSAYPRDIFTTLNINLYSGNRLQLSDVINIDYDFVNTVRETLNSYIDKYPEWEIVYKDKIGYDDDYFSTLFMQADSESGFDCFSYFTKDCLGISFDTSHAAGDHFEIEIQYEDIKDELKIDLYD